MSEERKLIEEARERANNVLLWLQNRYSLPPRSLEQTAEDVGQLADALEAALAREQQKDEAIREARRELWWFVERETGQGWGFDESDTEQICDRAMRIQDEILAPVLAVVPVETQEAAAPDDYTRPGWRMFPIF